jgi:formylglycine-generating enzyme required for sulfatase activity/dienelactone hydrolase
MGSHRDESAKPEGAQETGGSSDLSRDLTAATPAPGTGSRGTHAASIAPGTTLDHFEVLEFLGAGGFGEVYRARDSRLERMVAIKVLPEDFARDAERRERFRREAIAASALNHPNICTVYEFVEANGRFLIVMELVEGKTLHAFLANGPLSAEAAVLIALQIVDALAEAHRAGILHRDIKSGNIGLTERGQVKVFDFGLAKLFGPSPEKTEGVTVERLTAEGASLGTITHMSPEQLLGRAVDRRSDLFSFGVVLYEMVTGRLPFEGSTAIAVADAILHTRPRDFGDAPLPEKLKAVIRKLLEKEPEKRYASAEEVHAELKALADSLVPGRKARLPRNTRIALVAAGLVAITAAGWVWQRASRTRWARETATPEIARLLDADEVAKAAALVREARKVLPNDPTLEKLWKRATGEITVESVPTGADVSIRPYGGDPNAWESLGKTPLTKFRFPRGSYLLRVTAPGYIPALRICAFRFSDPRPFTFRLDREGSVPAEMVHIPAGKTGVTTPGLDTLPEVQLDDYLMDRTEVTNAEYKLFVDAGGYQKPEFWKHPFVKDGRTVSWEEAIALFHDSTGRPGPAGWELGQFPPGQDRHPVAGVSWYEAAAYAEFVGKSLPSVYHWCRAANLWGSEVFVPGSNFSGSGTVPVGGAGAANEYGTYDMAGNVKEWCWNERKDHLRFILGGGFGEPTYMFGAQDAQPPWHRAPTFGFRCVKLAGNPPDTTLATIDVPPVRDYSKEKPASDEAFRAYKGLYAYDKRNLVVHLDATEKADDWTTEIVSFDAGYGNERMIAYLCLPKSARPPYQTVIYFPGSGAIHTDKRLEFVANEGYAAIVPKSGRALLYPIYKGTYQRSDDLTDDTDPLSASYRDHTIAWAKDLSRSIDFLETRTDIDREKLAYLGFSWGAEVAPVMLAVEGRFKAAILVSGGLDPYRTLPEAEPFNFVSRVRIPVLMLNGRYDHRFPVEASQLPFFRSLGTPEKDKKHVIYESGHAPPRKDYIRESLDWLDKYLGPVKR